MDKKQERAIIEAFLQFYGYPLSALQEWKRERPDALVQIDGRMIGIEVTTVDEAIRRQSAPPQQWTTEAHRVVRAAQEAFERRYAVALIVDVTFKPGWQPRKSEAMPLGEEIATIIKTQTPQEAFAGAFFKPVQLKDPHCAVSRVYVGYTKPSLGGRWTPGISGATQCATAADILKTVSRKEADVEVYKRVAPHAWLLIDCNLTGQGIGSDVPNLSSDFMLTTGFDRVFCCGFSRSQWVEIPCKNAPTTV
jgi:hypothetical protein